MRTYHEPVMLQESVDALRIRPDGVYVDVTFGGGGHSNRILELLGSKGRLVVFDRDEDAAANVIRDNRLVFVRHNYRYLYQFMRYYDFLNVDGLLADLGISSYQIDEASRGFSIRQDAPLDMRMNRLSGMTAADVLNQYSEEELLKVFSAYGEVHNSKTLAGRIVRERMVSPISGIADFRKMIAPVADKKNETQYYAKVFQALRIEVNDEMNSLKEMLSQCIRVLKPGGRLAVITYHSLEDRVVKNFISKGKFHGELEKDLFGNISGTPFQSVVKKPVTPGEEELKKNPRSRSAKLRIAERTEH
ncbi:MAG: 16S rRNA (cytosine(1402)-N(4))-methyltransferase RsmH [Bacteroidetes bacterium]|nr:MAG: 16S rRNA (cytosine(1402)-N(4))-methyltransferase RsmH [Bacteroidota bacterium]REK03484.1 MAG: 16S rRNA (cytosine(1402)-N(4))-methyltransferase RsmH [Bacteroidota bacterium]REK34789.1 MAG: 16S rRNA (cytosine(1402)-N(4))-methyltransferase RsmH [Bacteroidota bacterium]REK51332.1 MAG: 16S rRNA (cytosine(1402)-N(4))-methyltransferase RsmH [Bacteroidota bacterium]